MVIASHSAKSLPQLQRLARSLHSFTHSLHIHHSIEDQHVFPFLASRTDISHLVTHHLMLDPALATLESLAERLQRVNDMSEYDSSEAAGIVSKVQAFVIEHENAEEAVLAVDNLRKCMSEDECRRWFPH